MINNRIVYLDLIRIAAIILVIACHLFGNTGGVSPILISFLSYIEMPCNAMFFAVSGALLLSANIHPIDTRMFLTKRLNKVIIPTLLWSIVYMFISDTLSFTNCIAMLFTPQGSNVLWFMYTMVGLYLVTPIISPYLQQTSKQNIQFYLAIWSITLCYPIISNWINPCTTTSGIGYYFSGYVGFYILGFYLRKYGFPLKLSALGYMLFLAIMIAIKLFAPNIKLYDGLWYLTIFDAASVIFYWNVLKLIADKWFRSEGCAKRLALISNLVFGVYFIHIAFIEYVIPNIQIWNQFPYLVSYTIKICITFVGALLISYLISLMPISNYIIGYTQKKRKNIRN